VVVLIAAPRLMADTNDLQVVSSVATNSELRLSISWPVALSGSVWEVYSVDLGTNPATSFSWLDLWWDLAETNLVLTGATPRVWTDNGQLGRPTPYQVDYRYYAFGRTSVDTDIDGIINAREYLIYKTSAADPDTDNDDLTDYDELYVHDTDPLDSDTDGDGMPDGWEVANSLNPLSGIHDSLVGWWRFDDGTGDIAVNSANTGYDGDLVNLTTSAWTSGKLDGALSFGGVSGYVEVAQSPALITGQQFTASAWVYLASDFAENYPTIIADYMLCGTGYEGFWMGYEPILPGPALLFGTCSSFTQPTANTDITGRWAHVVSTYDGTTGRIYVDGSLGWSDTHAFTPAERDYLYIGWDDDPMFTLHWKGKIDDVRLYASALSTNQITAMYDAFDDPDGDTLPNYQEYDEGTDPNRADTDTDGLPDDVDAYPLNPDTTLPVFTITYPTNGIVIH
jgi:hypothetical protein